PPPTEIYTLSLHDALPISEENFLAVEIDADGVIAGGPDLHRPFLGRGHHRVTVNHRPLEMAHHLVQVDQAQVFLGGVLGPADLLDRKSTRLNSSHVSISYA